MKLLQVASSRRGLSRIMITSFVLGRLLFNYLQHRLALIYIAMTIHCELLFNIFIIALGLVFSTTAFLNSNFQFSISANYFFLHKYATLHLSILNLIYFYLPLLACQLLCSTAVRSFGWTSAIHSHYH